MRYTKDIKVFKTLLKQNVPAEGDDDNQGKIVMYVQDLTTCIDYYIIYRSSSLDEFLALVDPLKTSNVLDLEYVPISFLEGSHLYCRIYSKKKQINWKKKYQEILPIKHGIPSESNR